jgi:hypothetical protein
MSAAIALLSGRSSPVLPGLTFPNIMSRGETAHPDEE